MKKDQLSKRISKLKERLDGKKKIYRYAIVDENGKTIEKYRNLTTAVNELARKKHEYFCKLKMVNLI